MATPGAIVRGRLRGLGRALGALGRFRRELYRQRLSLLAALLSSLAYSAVRLAEPWPLKIIFDNVLGGMPFGSPLPGLTDVLVADRWSLLVAAALAVLGLALLRGLLSSAQSLLTARIGKELALNLRRRLFAHIQRLSLSFHTRSSTGDLLVRLTSDIGMLREFLTASLVSLTSEAAVVVGFVAVMFLMEWRLALVAILVVPPIFLVVTLYSARLREAAREQRHRESELASRLQQALSGIHIVQMFAREREADEWLGHINAKSLASEMNVTRLETALQRTIELSLGAATAVTVLLGAMLVMGGRLTPGELIVFVSYLHGFYHPLRRVSRVMERAGKASSCVERVTALLDEVPEVRDGIRVAPAFRGALRFENVEFSYTPGVPVLKGITLAIHRGQTVALVGSSGEGKSTLLGLIPRLYDPTRGRVLIDGEDVREFTLASLREQISVVPQDGMLFDGTIRENIAYGKPDATDEELEAAASVAQIHDFIATLPAAYASRIGERGVTLSGGQRQRLAIARALVKDAPILLLDEPTTGLDSEAEGLVMTALDNLLEGRTALVIAHRLSTICRADLILVLGNGCIVECDTHEALMARGGRYRRLFEQQFAIQDHPLSKRAGLVP